MLKARQLIERVTEDDLEDLAYDFVEGVIGRYHFPKTWEKLSPEERRGLAEGWLRGHGERVTQPRELVSYVDKVAKEGLVWRR